MNKLTPSSLGGFVRYGEVNNDFVMVKGSVPGVKKRITIPLKIEDLAHWDTDNNKWAVEATTFKVMVGPDSATLPLSDTFVVKN